MNLQHYQIAEQYLKSRQKRKSPLLKKLIPKVKPVKPELSQSELAAMHLLWNQVSGKAV